jgi:hypothetical protein
MPRSTAAMPRMTWRRLPHLAVKAPSHVGTLGDLVLQDRGLMLYCENRQCLHHGEIDARQFPAALTLQSFLERAVCSKCGARLPEIKCHCPPKRSGSRP